MVFQLKHFDTALMEVAAAEVSDVPDRGLQDVHPCEHNISGHRCFTVYIYAQIAFCGILEGQ